MSGFRWPPLDASIQLPEAGSPAKPFTSQYIPVYYACIHVWTYVYVFCQIKVDFLTLETRDSFLPLEFIIFTLQMRKRKLKVNEQLNFFRLKGSSSGS